MYPSPGSTATPSGSRHPVTIVLESVPSGLSEKTRPPLRSSTNSRPFEEPGAVMFAPEQNDAFAGSKCALSTMPQAEPNTWAPPRNHRVMESAGSLSIVGECDLRAVRRQVESQPPGLRVQLDDDALVV